MNPIETLWTRARNRRGDTKAHRRPPAGPTQLLMTLRRRGPCYVNELAGITGQGQSNISYYWLPRLHDYGFVDIAEIVPGQGHQGGGRPAVVWRLTRAGREFAALLEAEGLGEAA